MVLEWLYRTSVETTILIALVLLLRPVVRKTLGANIVYWLWLLPLARLFLIDRPERSDELLKNVPVLSIDLPIDSIPLLPASNDLPTIIPWLTIWLVGIGLWTIVRFLTWLRFRLALQDNARRFVLTPILHNRIGGHSQHSIGSHVQLFTSDNPSTPFVTGLVKPQIYLPRNFLQQFSVHEQVWILVHELTHIRRKDLWVQLLGEIVRAVFWFNPAIHFALQLMREDQELACDSSVLANCSEEQRYQYGRALAAGMGPHLMPPVLRFFSAHKERFTMLSKHKVSTLNTIIGVSLCVMISVFALTKAPTTLAQRSFEEVYDANAPMMITGTVTDIEMTDPHTYLYIDGVDHRGVSNVWQVEGGPAQQMRAKGINESIIGKRVVVRGWQSLNKSCNPHCKLNGRDIEINEG